MSAGTLVFAGALVASATGAFFSDVETSSGNTFAAGSLDLLVDSQAHYAGLVCNAQGVWEDDPNIVDPTTRPDLLGEPCEGTWEMTNLGPGFTFFDLGDLKPGDEGENTISLHVENNDAYVCAIINNLEDDDNGLTEPEESAGDNTGGDGEGELSEEVNFFAWGDTNGNNIWENGELPLFAAPYFGPASDVLGGVSYPLYTPLNGPLPGDSTTYVGLAWCYGEMTVDVDNEVLTCDGGPVTNVTQTDSMAADISFYAEQARNNDDFTCPAPEEINPEAIAVGAALADYDAPVCSTTVAAGNSIQAAINAASAGDTICVAPGDYENDTYPLRVNKDNLTLASTGGPGVTTLSGGIVLDNDGTTVTGFTLESSTLLGETFGVYINTGADNVEVSYNDMNGPGVGSGRGVISAIGVTGALIANNEITNYLTGVFLNPSSNMLVELNDLVGNGVGSGNDNPTNNTLRRNHITGNSLEGVGVLSSGAESIEINFNNIFGNGGAANELNSYAVDAVDAENNWWGDMTPADEIGGVGAASVDFTPFANAVYAQN